MAPDPHDKTLRWTAEEIKKTPSRADGVSDMEERVQRFSAAEYARALIRVTFGGDRNQEESSNRVQILACYYIQVFYMFRSLHHDENKPKMVAVAATFLACKVADLPRKMRVILRDLNQMRVSSNEAELGAEEQRTLEERVLQTEFLILRMIHFDFDMPLPLEFLGELTEALEVQLTRCPAFCEKCKLTPQAEASKLRDELWKVAERFVLDSFMGFAPVVAPPKVVAAGALAMATRYIRRELGTTQLCLLLSVDDSTLDHNSVGHVVKQIMEVFRTKSHAAEAAAAAAAAAAPAAVLAPAPAPPLAATATPAVVAAPLKMDPPAAVAPVAAAALPAAGSPPAAVYVG